MSDPVKTPAPSDPPPAVGVKLAVNGRAVKDFPYRQISFADRLTPEKARRLVEFYLELVKESAP